MPGTQRFPRLNCFRCGCYGHSRADHGRARDRAEQVAKCRFIAEPLGEQPIGSEGSSRPALRTYFVRVYFTGTPVNNSELAGGCWGVGRMAAWALFPRRCAAFWDVYACCGSFSLSPSCVFSRLDTGIFQEKSVRLLPRSSSAWPYSSIMHPGCLASGSRWCSTDCDPMTRYSRW